jgi:hypothetical protein
MLHGRGGGKSSYEALALKLLAKGTVLEEEEDIPFFIYDDCHIDEPTRTKDVPHWRGAGKKKKCLTR